MKGPGITWGEEESGYHNERRGKREEFRLWRRKRRDILKGNTVAKSYLTNEIEKVGK